MDPQEELRAMEIDPAASEAAAETEQASQEFVVRWNRLVSTTNWEKGRIIQQWREALIASDAAPQEYSDEAWSRRVGGVTGQHVGRLRRVYQRFGAVYDDYPGLYWSHFQAAVDWEDAEMWLEGAVQSNWSVNGMRNQRWETLGQTDDDAAIVDQEVDEDFEPALNQSPAADVVPRRTEIQDASGEAAEEDLEAGTTADRVASSAEPDPRETAVAELDEEPPRVRPFAELPELPEDVHDAFQAFKLAILHHKGEQWRDISQEDLLASLDALKHLALAPS